MLLVGNKPLLLGNNSLILMYYSMSLNRDVKRCFESITFSRTHGESRAGETAEYDMDTYLRH